MSVDDSRKFVFSVGLDDCLWPRNLDESAFIWEKRTASRKYINGHPYIYIYIYWSFQLSWCPMKSLKRALVDTSFCPMILRRETAKTLYVLTVYRNCLFLDFENHCSIVNTNKYHCYFQFGDNMYPHIYIYIKANTTIILSRMVEWILMGYH